MKPIPLQFPLGGLSDAQAFEDQPKGTSTVMLNTTSIDPVTYRERGGPRAGCELYNENGLGFGKVQALVQSIVDNQRTTFTPELTVTANDLEEWSTPTPSKASTPDGVPDGFGNVIVFDGPAALIKLNSEGLEVWRFSLPIKDDGQICRAICLDPFGGLYIGVSDGGSQVQARIWAFSPDDDLHLKLRWQRKPGAFVERLRWQDGYLYSAENDIEGNRAYYALYEGADGLIAPEPAQRKDTRAAPINDFVVNGAGEVVTTHEPSATRCLDPRYPDYGYVLDEQRWTPKSLAQFKDRIWCHLDASTLASQIDYTNLKDGDEITIWRDRYGSGRKLVADLGNPSSAANAFTNPTYVEKGPCGRPAVRFSGNLCRLISEMNPNAEESMADLQRTILPGYKKCGYALVIVCKPSESTGEERIFAQANDSGGGDSREWWVNTTDAVGTVSSGKVYTNQGAASGSHPHSVRGQFDNRTSMCIITTVSANGHYPFGFSGHTTYDVAWRVNGNPLVMCKGNDFHTGNGASSKTVIGCLGDETKGFTGDITDIFVLRDYTPEDGSPRTVCTVPDYPNGVNGYDANSDTEIEQIEGYFAWQHGIPHMLDDGAFVTTGVAWDADGAHSTFKHAFSSDITAPYTTQQGPPNPNGRNGDATSPSGSWDIDMLSVDPMTVKWSPQRGNVKWVNVGSGQGYGIAIDSEDSLYTIGPVDSTGFAYTLRKWLDRGTSVTNPWNKFFEDTVNDPPLALSPGYHHLRMAVDAYDNLFVPYHWAGAAITYSLLAFDSDGNEIISYTVTNSLFGYGVAIDPTYPEYGSQNVTLPEFVYLFTRNNGLAANATVHKIRLVSREITSGSARNTTIVAVCDGNIKRFSSGASPAVQITGGVAALDPGALPCGIWAFQKVWFIDGTSDKVYDPIADVVTDWRCTSAGSIPKHARWMTLWNGRCWRIRAPGDPHNWHASAQGDFEDWDTNPAVVVPTQAISGNDAEMGMFPDIPNTLIPASRERLYIGCDHTIQLVYGDPMIGGSITEVSNETGASFGPSWCRDDEGRPYFFGSRGGVYALGSQGCKSISGNIDRRMMDVNLSDNYVQLAWNSELGELWVMEMPYGVGGVSRRLWRWQKKMGAWHEDSYFDPLLQPTCFATYDADLPGDRAFLFGAEDSRVCNWSRTAKDDRGFPINCRVVLGPYGIATRESRIGHPTIVLATDQGGCNFAMFASESADKMGDPVHRTKLVPGRNQTLFQTLRGSRVWCELSSNAAGNRWSFERGDVVATDVGRQRVRS